MKGYEWLLLALSNSCILRFRLLHYHSSVMNSGDFLWHVSVGMAGDPEPPSCLLRERRMQPRCTFVSMWHEQSLNKCSLQSHRKWEGVCGKGGKCCTPHQSDAVFLSPCCSHLDHHPTYLVKTGPTWLKEHTSSLLSTGLVLENWWKKTTLVFHCSQNLHMGHHENAMSHQHIWLMASGMVEQ